MLSLTAASETVKIPSLLGTHNQETSSLLGEIHVCTPAYSLLASAG